MQHYMYRLPLFESPDIPIESRRRRVDLGMPRGFLAGLSGKGETDAMLNGTDDMMENGNIAAADLLRKMLHKQNGSVMSEKNGHDTSEKAKTGDFDDMKMITNGFQQSEADDKSSDETEALESGTDEGSITDKTSIKENCNGSLSPTPSSTKDDLKAKRARVENIITSMRKSPTPFYHPYQMTGDGSEAKRPKRKQYQPQQQTSDKAADPSEKKHGRRRTEKLKLKKLLGNLQEQLNVLQEKYCELYEEDNSSLSDDESDMDDLREPIDTLSAIHICEQQARIQAKKRAAAENAALLAKGTPRHLRDSLKKELARTVYSAVDNVVEEFASKHIDTQYSSTTPAPVIADTVPLLQFPNKPQQSPGSSNKSPRQTPTPQRSTPHRFEEEQTEALPLIVPKCNNRVIKSSPSERSRTSSPAAPTPSQQIAAAAAAAAAEARAEAVAASEILRHPFLPAFLPTSVAIPNPSLHPFSAMSLVSSASTNAQKKEQKDLFEEMRYTHSPLLSYPHPAHHPAFLHAHGAPPPPDHSNGSDMSPQDHMSPYSQIKMEEGVGLGRGSPDLSPYSRAANANSGLLDQLTPTHLRKAKLMFFYTRYPSSALLRQHFPDVQFNRHNTSQIIKWFSNFREFYYIQMEKFARQAYGDGVEDSDSLIVTKDSELFRVLSLHYNKSNDFAIPNGFLNVSTNTLREFFDAIKLKKDAEPSWKKTIYKVIGKLDEMLPEIFKSPTCLEELEVLSSR